MKRSYIKIYKEPCFLEKREKPTLLAEGEFKFVHWFVVDRGSFITLGIKLPKTFEFDINKVPGFGSKAKACDHLYIYESLVLNRDSFVSYKYSSKRIKETQDLVNISTEVCKYFIALSLNKVEVNISYTMPNGERAESINTIDGVRNKVNRLYETGATDIVCKYS